MVDKGLDISLSHHLTWSLVDIIAIFIVNILISLIVKRSTMVMTPACRVRVDGRKRRFSKPLISYVICYKNYACSVRDVIVFSAFLRFHVDGRKRFKNPTSKCVFFENRKNLRFQKIRGYVLTGPYCMRTLRAENLRSSRLWRSKVMI